MVGWEIKSQQRTKFSRVLIVGRNIKTVRSKK